MNGDGLRAGAVSGAPGAALRAGTATALALAVVAILAGAAPNRRAATYKDGLVDTAAVVHDPNGLDQLVWATSENPALRFLFLRLAMKTDDVMSAGARIYRVSDQYEGFKDYDLEPYARTGSTEYRSLTIPFEDEPLADDLHSRWRGYRMWLDDGDKIFWAGPDTIATKEEQPKRFKVLFRPRGTFAPQIGTGNPDSSGVSDQVLFIPAWVQDAVFYEIDPDRFRNGDTSNDPSGVLKWDSPPRPGGRYGGDLRGVIDALPYLDSLGVTAIYLKSIFRAAGNTDDAADYDSVEPHYGDEALFKELVDTAHRRNMKVMLEGAFDHISSTHPYFRDAVDFGEKSDLWTWFHFQGYPVITLPGPNYATWNGRADLPAWNFDNPDTRNYLINAGLRWIEANIDGWGLESPAAAPHEFWFQFRQAVKAMDARAYVVGRLHGPTRSWNMGDQFDAVTDDRFRAACRGFFADTTLDAAGFDEALSRIRVATPDPLNRISFNALDSDSAGFAADGRSGPPLPPALEKLRVLFELTYTGAPVLRAGEETGSLTGSGEPRGSFAWRSADQNASLREYYRRLLLLRRDNPALRRGSFVPVVSQGGTYAYIRRSAEEVLLVVLNRTNGPASFKLSLPRGTSGVTQRDAVDLLSGSRHAIRSGEVHVKDVPPLSGAILKLQ